MSTPAAPRDATPLTATGPRGPFGYTDEGQGPAVVAVHGLPGSTRDWRWLAAALPDTVRLVRLDLPGFGETPVGSGQGPGIDQRGSFVAGALAALGVERCVLVGHSMGGPAALSAAVQAPERVAALALVASVGLRPHRLLRGFLGLPAFALAVDLPLLAGPTRALLRAAFLQGGFPARTSPAEVAQTLRCLAAVDFAVQQANTAALRVPTLTAWAEDDPFIEAPVMAEHAAALPAGPRLSWPRGGHNVQKSQAVELAAVLVAMARAL